MGTPLAEAAFHESHAAPRFAYFEYRGSSGLTVLGPLSGQRYRFSAPGARLAVDGRDAPSLAAVPELHRLRAPVLSG